MITKQSRDFPFLILHMINSLVPNSDSNIECQFDESLQMPNDLADLSVKQTNNNSFADDSDCDTLLDLSENQIQTSQSNSGLGPLDDNPSISTDIRIRPKVDRQDILEPRQKHCRQTCCHWNYTEHGSLRRRTYSYPISSRPFRLYPLPRSGHVNPVCARCQTSRGHLQTSHHVKSASLGGSLSSGTLIGGLVDWVRGLFSRPTSEINQVELDDDAKRLKNNFLSPDLIREHKQRASSLPPSRTNKTHPLSVSPIIAETSSQMDLTLDIPSDQTKSDTSMGMELSPTNTMETATAGSRHTKNVETDTVYFSSQDHIRSASWLRERRATLSIRTGDRDPIKQSPSNARTMTSTTYQTIPTEDMSGEFRLSNQLLEGEDKDDANRGEDSNLLVRKSPLIHLSPSPCSPYHPTQLFGTTQKSIDPNEKRLIPNTFDSPIQMSYSSGTQGEMDESETTTTILGIRNNREMQRSLIGIQVNNMFDNSNDDNDPGYDSEQVEGTRNPSYENSGAEFISPKPNESGTDVNQEGGELVPLCKNLQIQNKSDEEPYTDDTNEPMEPTSIQNGFTFEANILTEIDPNPKTDSNEPEQQQDSSGKLKIKLQTRAKTPVPADIKMKTTIRITSPTMKTEQTFDLTMRGVPSEPNNKLTDSQPDIPALEYPDFQKESQKLDHMLPIEGITTPQQIYQPSPDDLDDLSKSPIIDVDYYSDEKQSGGFVIPEEIGQINELMEDKQFDVGQYDEDRTPAVIVSPNEEPTDKLEGEPIAEGQLYDEQPISSTGMASRHESYEEKSRANEDNSIMGGTTPQQVYEPFSVAEMDEVSKSSTTGLEAYPDNTKPEGFVIAEDVARTNELLPKKQSDLDDYDEGQVPAAIVTIKEEPGKEAEAQPFEEGMLEDERVTSPTGIAYEDISTEQKQIIGQDENAPTGAEASQQVFEPHPIRDVEEDSKSPSLGVKFYPDPNQPEGYVVPEGVASTDEHLEPKSSDLERYDEGQTPA